MGYEIIALDIDGTLTDSHRELTPRTINTLIEAQKRGKKVILASGRHNCGMRSIAETLKLDEYEGYIMAFNGGKIINASTNEVIYSVNFPRKYIASVLDSIKGSGLTVITYDDEKIIMDKTENEYTYIEAKIVNMEYKKVDDILSYVDFEINKMLLVGDPKVINEYERILVDKFKGYFDVFKSCPFFLELMPFGVNKGASLSRFLPEIGYTRENLIACGDSYNDMTMIGYAGLGVCMKNGEKDVKKIADVIAESNDDDGVAKIVEQYML